MPLPTTEDLHPDAMGLDARPLPEAARILHAGQMAALRVVENATAPIATAAERMAETLRAGHRLIYVAAGSSGLMALADAAELGATFGIPDSQIVLHMAGGVPTDARMPGNTEDDSAAASDAAKTVQAGDLVIALSASGTTPFPLAFVEAARPKGVTVVAIANNAGAPLLAAADVPILLATPPEVISGSTRMGAGTAQKVALNMMSTLMGIALGHVHDGMMVNLVADNAKLQQRAAGMVAHIAGIPSDVAQDFLTRTGGAVKPAVLLAAGVPEVLAADTLLTQTRGNLRQALARFNDT